MSALSRQLEEVALKIDDLAQQIDDLVEWSECEGFRAVEHKLEEAAMPLRSAANAARQYASGKLEPR